MSYEFIKKYNVLEACGWSGGTEKNAENNLARIQAVRDWINAEMGDIFYASTSSAADSTNNGYVLLYFRGTSQGLYIQHSNYSTSGPSYNHFGTRHDGGYYQTSDKGIYLSKGEINMLVAKNKYGIIAGFYTTDSSAVRTAAINTGSEFIPIVFNTATASYIRTGKSAEGTFNLTASTLQNQAILQKFYPPYLDTEVEGVYWNVGQHLTNCVPYRIEGTDKLFMDVPGVSGCSTLTMELVEPTYTTVSCTSNTRGYCYTKNADNTYTKVKLDGTNFNSDAIYYQETEYAWVTPLTEETPTEGETTT